MLLGTGIDLVVDVVDGGVVGAVAVSSPSRPKSSSSKLSTTIGSRQ